MALYNMIPHLTATQELIIAGMLASSAIAVIYLTPLVFLYATIFKGRRSIQKTREPAREIGSLGEYSKNF